MTSAPTPVAALAGAGIGAVVCLAATPYLARLTRSVTDRDLREWWRWDTVAGRPGGRRTAATAAVAVVAGGLAGAAAGLDPRLPAFVALALALTPLAVVDVETHRLPDRLTGPAALAAAVLLAVAAAADGAWHPLLRALEGAAAVFAVLLVFALASPKAFGMGDVKLGGVLGAHLGWFGWYQVFYGVFAGFLLGALVGVVLLLLGRAGRKTPIPFGPMLGAGALLVLAFQVVPPGT